MLEKPFLSICIPTFNRAEVVYGCVQNVLKSERNDIECVVCDNCSTDNTKEKLSSIKDERFCYYRNEYNMGYVNIHEVMKHANGVYCFLLSDEDDIDLATIEKLIAILKREKEMGVIVTNCNERRNRYYTKGKNAVSRLAMILPGYMTGICFLQKAVMEIENDINKDNFFYQLFPHQYMGILVLGNYDGLSVIHNFANVGARKAEFVDYKSLAQSKLGLHWEPDSRFKQFEGEIQALNKLNLSEKDKILAADQLLYAYHSMLVFNYYQIIKDRGGGWKLSEERAIKVEEDKKKSGKEWKAYSEAIFKKLKQYLEEEYLRNSYRHYLGRHLTGLFVYIKKGIKKYLTTQKMNWK